MPLFTLYLPLSDRPLLSRFSLPCRPMQKILIIQTAFIGDVVLATALVEKLHSQYPNAAIDFLVRRGNEGLLQGHPLLRHVLVWNKKQHKYKHLFQLLAQIRKVKYDMVVNVQRFAATGLLTAFSGAKYTVGFDKNPWSFLFTKKVQHLVSSAARPVHEIERNQLLIADVTDAQPAKPRLYPSQADAEKVKPYQSLPYICIAPSSVWFTKRFPAHKWIAFVQQLPQSLHVILLGGPEDMDLCESIRLNAGRSNVLNLAGKLNFLQSVALQKTAKMNYVNDSAPMHFASAVNAPVAAVYCSTIPAFGFGPLSDQSYIIEVAESLDCRPCGLHGFRECPKGHFKCAEDIEVAQLIQILE